MSEELKLGTLSWLVPLLFVGCAAWVIWNGPAYIIAFGGASDALKNVHTTAGLIDYIALLGLPVTFIWGLFHIHLAKMEYESMDGFDRASLFLGRVTMLLVALLVSVMLYEVVLRYAFERPTLWANELSLWIAGFVFLLSGLYAMAQRSHIRIFILYDVMPRWLQKTCDVISTVLIVIFAFALIYGGYGEATSKFLRWETFGTAFDPPIPATIKPLCLFVITLVAIQAVSNLIMDWNKAPEHHSTDEVDEDEIEMLKRTLGSDD